MNTPLFKNRQKAILINQSMPIVISIKNSMYFDEVGYNCYMYRISFAGALVRESDLVTYNGQKEYNGKQIRLK